VTLPLPLRNRVAALILDALHDPGARAGLEALATACASGSVPAAGMPEELPGEIFERRGDRMRLRSGWARHAPELAERSARACRALRGRPLDPADASLAAALEAAAVLFDAGLYFEVHEQLEPHWMRATGRDREALQGLIQAAVGLQHLANGNAAGARALLRDGCGKLPGRRPGGLELDAFARALARCLDEVVALGAEAPRRFDWSTVPRFPTARRAREIG
jgi:hypothetical protein